MEARAIVHFKQALRKGLLEQLGPEGREPGALDGPRLTSNVSPHLLRWAIQGPGCFPRERESLFYPQDTKHLK